MSAWNRWVAFWMQEEPGTPLALFRLAVGATLTWNLLDMVTSGVVRPIWFGVAHGGIGDRLTDHWLIGLLGTSPAAVVGLLTVTIAACALVTVGLGTRVAAFVALQGCLALFSLHPISGGGHDRLATNALWLLVLGPSDTTLSLACRLRTGRFTSDAPASAWTRRLAIVQLVLVYCVTGLQKMGPEWVPWGDRSAVYLSLLLPAFERFDNAWVAHVYPLTQVATVTTWLWEIGAPILLIWFWWRPRVDLRSLYLAYGLAMHVTLWIFLDLGPFSAITLAFYPCFYHHDEYVSALRSSSAWPSRHRSREAPSEASPPP